MDIVIGFIAISGFLKPTYSYESVDEFTSAGVVNMAYGGKFEC